jgi:DNA-binding phage protein
MTRNAKKTVKRILKRKKTPFVKAMHCDHDVKSVSYQDYLLKTLKDPKEAAGYLNAALSGGDIKVFLLALQNMANNQRIRA